MIALAAGFAWPPAPAAAQATFTWPDTTVDVAEYATVEECLVAVERVARGYERREAETVWRDTLPWEPTEAHRAPPAPVTETARRCSAKFAATVPLEDFSPMLRLFLHAARDADVATLVDRRLAALAPKAQMERAWVIDSVVTAYITARPMRLAPALNLARTLGRPTHADLIERSARVYGAVLGAAQKAGDTALAQALAGEMIAFVESIPPGERRKLEDKSGPAFGWALYALMEMTTDPREFLDSLRVSTAAFVRQKRALWAKATGERPEAMMFPIGERAPTLEGDFWFERDGEGQRDSAGQRDGAAEPRPRPGRVSLVVFESGDCSYCDPYYAAARRLATRFPELDITIVAQTRGYFQYVLPPSPAEEATLIQRNLAANRVPGTYVVSAAEFWRLPDPDRRQIMRDLANVTNYTFDTYMSSRNKAFLVDPDGVIVYAGLLARGWPEERLTELIAVLFDRPAMRS